MSGAWKSLWISLWNSFGTKPRIRLQWWLHQQFSFPISVTPFTQFWSLSLNKNRVFLSKKVRNLQRRQGILHDIVTNWWLVLQPLKLFWPRTSCSWIELHLDCRLEFLLHQSCTSSLCWHVCHTTRAAIPNKKYVNASILTDSPIMLSSLRQCSICHRKFSTSLVFLEPLNSSSFGRSTCGLSRTLLELGPAPWSNPLGAAWKLLGKAPMCWWAPSIGPSFGQS